MASSASSAGKAAKDWWLCQIGGHRALRAKVLWIQAVGLSRKVAKGLAERGEADPGKKSSERVTQRPERGGWSSMGHYFLVAARRSQSAAAFEGVRLNVKKGLCERRALSKPTFLRSSLSPMRASLP